MRDRAKTCVKRHTDAAVEQLLDWCDQHADSHPREVTAVGLAYYYGLNEHQIAASRGRTFYGIAIEYPTERRAAKIGSAKYREIEIEEPQWLAAAISFLTAAAAEPRPLLSSRRRIGSVSAAYVRDLVVDAAAKATGLVMSCASLNSTRTAELAELRLPHALYHRGYAPSYVARLIDPKIEAIKPRRRSR